MVRNDLRNVAIIAHVDHGKTTLVDALLRQSGAFRDNQAVAERVMDSGDIERERGITILAKNCSCTYKGVKINIVDTPGHADFGGEVERVLKMVNGVLLLVDAAEGCMPQTRFVLQKALQQNLSLVVAINKIDRPDARIKEVIDEVLYLLMDLGATDEQLDCPMLFCCGRDGTASLDPDVPGTDLIPLFDTLLSTIKPPEGDPEAPFQMLVSSVDYNDFVGRIGIGRIQNGVAKVGEEVVVCDWHNPDLKMRGRLTKLYDFQANGRQPCDNITAGDIVAFSGLPDVTIGNTLCSPSNVEPLPFVKINDPTVEMTFSVNDSPLAGREGKFVTSRQIRDRLQKELLKDVALKVEDSATTDSFRVMGRGEMHLSILIETMRREGYELQVSPPHVLTKVIDGKTYEPMEHVVIDVPTQYQGAVMTGLGQRKAILQQMESLGSDRVRLEFRMPSRGLFGYRNQFLTDTHGEGIINQIFDGYDVWAGMIANRSTGSLVSFETGEAVTYGLFNAQQRGTLHILFLTVAAQIGDGHRAVFLFQLQHLVQFHVDEVLHAGVLQADAVDEAGGGLPQALALVAVLAVQGQALAGDAADLGKVGQFLVLHTVAHGAGCADDGAVHRKAQQVRFQVSHQKNTSVASKTGPFLHTLLPSPLFVSQVQPRQAPMPQAIFFSMLTKQGVPFSAHRRAALRIMTVGPHTSTTS